MLRSIVVLALGALSVAAVADDKVRVTPGADDAGTRSLATLMDVNRDGVISREEFRRHNADRARWQALDRNEDGMLDTAEQATGLRPGPRILR